jgi:hypothetical protein
MMPRRRLVLCLVVTAALAGVAGSARADIDPASDVLPLQNIFLPYKPKVCTELSSALRNLTTSGKKAGYPVKVAVIGSKADLGGAAYLFGKPEDYAQFLAQELVTYSPDFGTTYGTQPLLTVMPSGFGIMNGGPKAGKILKEVAIPSGAGPNELVRASLNVIPRLAGAAGHPVASPTVASKCSKSGGGTSVLIFIAPIAVLLIGGVLAGSRLRPRPGPAT